MTLRAGLDLVKKYESCRLEAYQDSRGIWTIGWGHTHDVHEGDTCTQDQADTWLLQEYDQTEEQVQNAVTVDLTDNQLGALTSFVYNIGMGEEGVKDGLAHLNAGGQSHLLIYTNRSDFDRAAQEFTKWSSCNGVILQGLWKRRDEERVLFITP